MHKNVKKALAVVVATGGLALAGAGAASADTAIGETADNSNGLITGNNVGASLNAPILLGGNAVGVLGAGINGSYVGPATPDQFAGAAGSTWGDNGVISGNNALLPLNVPISGLGNAVGVLGLGLNGSAQSW